MRHQVMRSLCRMGGVDEVREFINVFSLGRMFVGFFRGGWLRYPTALRCVEVSQAC